MNERPNEPEKRIWLWGVPRCRSTALERGMMQRKDTTVISEPLINLYYNGPERRSDRNLHADVAEQPWKLQDIVKLMLANVLKPHVFSKNMGYYLAGRMNAKSTRRLLEHGVNSFIIRDPRAALPSHFKEDSDFNIEEAGYAKLRTLFDIVTNEIGQQPVIVDGDTFCREPSVMMRKYCEAIGIPFDESSLRWESKQVPEFDGYANWTEAAERSTGFVKPPEKLPDLGKLPPRIAEMSEQCRKHYEYLLQYAIQVNAPHAA